MNINEIFNYLLNDITKYAIYDENIIENKNRENFMKLSFIFFFILIIMKIIHLILIKLNLC